MASDDGEDMKDLFGSDDEEEGDKGYGKASLRPTGKGDADGTAATEDGLEDDLGDGGAARQLPEEEEQAPDDDGGWGSKAQDRRRRNGPRPLAKTGAPIDYVAPLLAVPPPSGEVFLLREALIAIEAAPFSPDTFAGEEEIFVDEKGHTKVKPVDRTKIRWRYAARRAAEGEGGDGGEEHVLVPESNARFVRWSDGSLQLLLGDEAFDVVTADVSQQHAYMVAYSGVVQGQAALTTKMGFRLATLNSKLASRMRDEVDRRTMKVKRVQQHVEALDPAKEKERRAREAEEMLRNRAQLETRQARTMARYTGGGGGGRGRRARPELNTRFLEEEDGLEGGGGGGDDGFIDDGEEEGGAGAGAYSRRRRLNEDEEAEAARRLQSAKRAGGAPQGAAAAGSKRRRAKDQSEEEEEEDDEEEEEYVDSEGGSEDEEGEEEEGGGGEEEEDEGEEEEEERPGKKSKAAPPKAKAAAPPRRGGRAASPPPRRGGGGGGRASPPPARGEGRQQGPPTKARRGVVLSDDEDE